MKPITLTEKFEDILLEYDSDEITNKTAVEHCLKVVSKNVQEIIELVDAYWKFNSDQQPVSNWHSKQDLIEKLKTFL